MDKPIIFLDMDGCIANQGKIWFEVQPKFLATEFGPKEVVPGGIGVYKQIADHDSWAIDTVKKNAHIIIISGDERINKAWAKRRGVPFIFTCAAGFHQDKWEFLKEYWNDNFEGDPYGKYYYLGDAMPDYKCMANAKQAFMPADACQILKRINKNLNLGFVQLETISGRGVFEEMVLKLMDLGVVNSDILKGYELD